MRRLCRLVTGIALLTTLALGCGSSAEDSAVLRFISFDNTGIVQQDAVTPTSAVVCVNNLAGPVTPTSINAIFLNEESADIQLLSYTVHFNDPSSGLADVTASVSGNPDLVGGECSTGFTRCAVDADCLASGGGSTSGGTTANCVHTETTVNGIILVDFAAKQHVNPAIYGQTTSLTVTFNGVDDAHNSLQVAAGYAVVFSNRIDCGSAVGGQTPVATATATATTTVPSTPTFTATPFPVTPGGA